MVSNQVVELCLPRALHPLDMTARLAIMRTGSWLVSNRATRRVLKHTDPSAPSSMAADVPRMSESNFIPHI